jgi:hypothetical protein
MQTRHDFVNARCNFVTANAVPKPENGRILTAAGARIQSGLKFIATPLMQ